MSGRVVKDVQRYGEGMMKPTSMWLLADTLRVGKVFYIELEGDGRHPVMHFGMTGLLQVSVHQTILIYHFLLMWYTVLR